LDDEWQFKNKFAFQNSSFRRLVDKNPEEEKEPNIYRQEDAAKRRAPAVGRSALRAPVYYR
jgi:hypothetical protein